MRPSKFLKHSIVEQAAACTMPGEVGALLRRERADTAAPLPVAVSPEPLDFE